MGKPTIDEVIEDIKNWSDTDEGKKHIIKAYLQLQDASEKLKKEAYLSPDKLKIIINI